MNINAISEFGKGKQLSCISLARIADYLDCSVDYLLGRTDKPEINKWSDMANRTDIQPNLIRLVECFSRFIYYKIGMIFQLRFIVCQVEGIIEVVKDNLNKICLT